MWNVQSVPKWRVVSDEVMLGISLEEVPHLKNALELGARKVIGGSLYNLDGTSNAAVKYTKKNTPSVFQKQEERTGSFAVYVCTC